MVTVVHRPDDARILHRQIASLHAEGFVVTYAAPWSATRVEPPPGIAVRDLPRATGRDRLAALLAARDLLRREAADHDLVLIHDPDLLLAVRWVGVGRLPPVVWDVHEDTAVALGDRAWLPGVLRGLAALLIRRLERWAERSLHLLLAEEGYRERFSRPHPVVRNHPRAAERPDTTLLGPPDLPPRVVYVGRLSAGRGLRTMIDLGRALHGRATLELAGDVDDDLRAELEAAVEEGSVVWHGFVPNDRVRALLAGASVGLSLLADDPNYRSSMPSKIIEYLASGVPVVATPLPTVAELVGSEGGGLLVPFDDVDAAHAAVMRTISDGALRAALVSQGLEAAARRTWEAEGVRLVAMLRTWAA